jgi:hypothetical protein
MWDDFGIQDDVVVSALSLVSVLPVAQDHEAVHPQLSLGKHP